MKNGGTIIEVCEVADHHGVLYIEFWEKVPGPNKPGSRVGFHVYKCDKAMKVQIGDYIEIASPAYAAWTPSESLDKPWSGQRVGKDYDIALNIVKVKEPVKAETKGER